MKRRDFLKIGAPLGMAPIFLNSIAVRAMSNPALLPPGACAIEDRIVVYVFLFGANDGINNVIPINQFSNYVSLRPNIHIAQNKLIELDNTLPLDRQVGLHPSLLPFKELYDNDRLKLIQGVSYPDPNKSHFRSAELLMTGQDGNSGQGNSQSDGWMANYLQNRYPEYAGLPLPNMSDPLAVQLGTPGHASSQGLKHDLEHDMETVLYGQDPAGFYTKIAGLSGQPLTNFPNSDYGDAIEYMAGVETATNAYAQTIQQRFNAGSNAASANYGKDNLSGMLKSVARLISGGSQTKIYMTNKGGFDNHVNQVDGNDSSIGKHADLLAEMSSAIKTFQEDLESQGLADRVITVVFSEFGRKALENDNNGTDHGTLAPMYIIGKHVAGGVIGDNIDLGNLDNQGAPNPNQLQNDYRVIHSTILQDWMGASNSAIETTFGTEDWVASKLPILETNQVTDPSCYIDPLFSAPTKPLKIIAMLEGAYEQSSGLMRTDLTDQMPTTDPYFGTTQATAIASDWVDWVLVQIRSAADPTQVLAEQAAILRSDGYLVDINGQVCVEFTNVGQSTAYVALYHRNHLPVMTSDPVSLAHYTLNFLDFTDDTVTIFDTDTRNLVNGKALMLAGDASFDGSINDADRNDFWRLQNGQTLPYDQSQADFNLDGTVNAVDLNTYWRKALNTSSQIPR